NGSSWAFGQPAGTVLSGTPLNQWTGAVLRSNTNGTTDGRVFIAAKVTPTGNGTWHYEYALHNRDNGRGIAGFHLPKCPTAQISGAGFRDIDKTTFDDWPINVASNEIAVLAAAGNALEWNTIYNVWFDSDAAPGGGAVTLDEARVGPGPLQFSVLDVPSPLRLANETLGAGCGAPAPGLPATGNPALPTIPNASYGLRIDAHPSTVLLLFAATAAIVQPLGGGCFQYVDGATAITLGTLATDPSGQLAFALAVPNDPGLEGVDLTFQAAETFAGG